jgi:hypothetical protein
LRTSNPASAVIRAAALNDVSEYCGNGYGEGDAGVPPQAEAAARRIASGTAAGKPRTEVLGHRMTA